MNNSLLTKLIIITFLFSVFFYVFLIYVLGIAYYQESALLDEIFVVAFSYFIGREFFVFKKGSFVTLVKNDKDISSDLTETKSLKIYILPLNFSKFFFNNEFGFCREVAFIVIGSTILSVININIFFNHLDSDEVSKSLTISLASVVAVMAQLGGWFIQVLLIFFLSFGLVGSAFSFSFYSKIVGFAYIGFFISSIVIIMYNYFFLEQKISIDHINVSLKDSYFHYVVSKAGEFYTLIFIAFTLLQSQKVSYFTSFVLAFIPNILLLGMQLLLK